MGCIIYTMYTYIIIYIYYIHPIIMIGFGVNSPNSWPDISGFLVFSKAWCGVVTELCRAVVPWNVIICQFEYEAYIMQQPL